MNIAIVTTGHPPFDERIFYKIARSLNNYGHSVSVICSTEAIDTESDGISVKGLSGDKLPREEKIRKLYEYISIYNPSLIICCEPLTIFAANKYKKQSPHEVKIIYDVTEYYPHQNMLNLYSGLRRWLYFLGLTVFNATAANLSDYLFIGEKGKAKLYNLIAPIKKKEIIGYYPPKEFFQYAPPPYDGTNFTLCYAGSNSRSGGFRRYIALIKLAASLFPGKIFTAKVIGMDSSGGKDMGLEKYHNIITVYTGRIDFKKYASEFSGTDICIDLRDKDIIYNRSLPIKVFDYIACGKPFIFSNLDSFKGFEDLSNAGIFIEPDDIESAMGRLSLYINSPNKLKMDSLAARKLFDDKYNWELVEIKMMRTINSLFKYQ